MYHLDMTQQDTPQVLASTGEKFPSVVGLNPNERLLARWFVSAVSGFPEPFHGVLGLTNQRLVIIEVEKQAERVGVLGPRGIRFVWMLREATRLEDIAHLEATQTPTAVELMVDGRLHTIVAGDRYPVTAITSAREGRRSRMGVTALVTAGVGAVATKEIHREVVKVSCRYCGALTTQTEKNCSACGAPLIG